MDLTYCLPQNKDIIDTFSATFSILWWLESGESSKLGIALHRTVYFLFYHISQGMMSCESLFPLWNLVVKKVGPFPFAILHLSP